MESPDPPSASASNLKPKHLYIAGACGRVATSSTHVRSELESLAAALRSIVGARGATVRYRPYRHERAIWWAFEVNGCDGSAMLTFIEGGSSRLPDKVPTDGTSELADSADAFYLFEFLMRELTDRPGGF